MKWTWVSLHFATFGLGHRDGVVVEAPPIARWTIGKSLDKALDHYRRRGATIIPLEGT